MIKTSELGLGYVRDYEKQFFVSDDDESLQHFYEKYKSFFLEIDILSDEDVKKLKEIARSCYEQTLEECFGDIYKIAKKELIDFYKILKKIKIKKIHVEYENGDIFDISEDNIYYSGLAETRPIHDEITKYFDDVKNRFKIYADEDDKELEELQEKYDSDHEISTRVGDLVVDDMTTSEDLYDQINVETDRQLLKELRKRKRESDKFDSEENKKIKN